MEDFSAYEKVMKTKASSKEGRVASATLKPRERQRQEVINKCQQIVKILFSGVRRSEAEIEVLQGTKKMTVTGKASGRLAELKYKNGRRRWHINRLEIMSLLLGNGFIATYRVQVVLWRAERFSKISDPVWRYTVCRSGFRMRCRTY